MSERLLKGLGTLFLLLACGLAAWSAQQALQHQTLTLEITATRHLEPQLVRIGKQSLEAISFGLYEGLDQDNQRLATMLRQQQQSKRYAWAGLTGFGLLVILSLLLRAVSRLSWRQLGHWLSLLAVPALCAGIVSPMLLLVASKDLPVLGETIVQARFKSVIGSIHHLWLSDARLIAVAIALFSVLIPLAKGLVIASLFNYGAPATESRRYRWISLIGKWSMADVFVIAILLSYYGGKHQPDLQAGLGIGFWWFASYVLLSLSGTQLVGSRR